MAEYSYIKNPLEEIIPENKKTVSSLTLQEAKTILQQHRCQAWQSEDETLCRVQVGMIMAAKRTPFTGSLKILASSSKTVDSYSPVTVWKTAYEMLKEENLKLIEENSNLRKEKDGILDEFIRKALNMEAIGGNEDDGNAGDAVEMD